MTKGNLIVLKGHRNTGKTQFAASVIKNFVAENPTHKAVYVGMTSQGRKIQESVGSDNLLTIGVDDDSLGSYLIAPLLAVKAAVA